MDTPNDSAFLAHPPRKEPGDPVAAKKLAQGLTLVPYWTYNPEGRRVAQVRPGESLSQAAWRLTRAAQKQFTP